MGLNQSNQRLTPTDVVDHLKSVVEAYLAERPHMSVNALSKKCKVSEPTLRRILSKKIKTIPHASTLLDILTYITQESNIKNVASRYPGPIEDFILQQIPTLKDEELSYSKELDEAIKDPVKYLIYKLISNT